MVTVVEITNPFEPLKDSYSCEIEAGGTIFDYLNQRFPSFVEFTKPTICTVNGKPVFRGAWKTQILKDGDVVNFVAVIGFEGILGWVIAALLVASVGYTVYALATMPKPRLPGETPEADPVYGLTGQRNQIKLGSAIECSYGRVRLWPSYAARPYTKFIGNDQWFYGLYCLGQGTFDISAVQIEDTPIANFQDVTYEIYEPGDEVTLFPDNVITSVEVAGIEIFATNEDDYVAPGSGFIANPTATDANHLEVDLVFPQGLYAAQDDGSLGVDSIVAAIEYREVDDSGTPIGSWILPSPLTTSGVVVPHNFYKSLNTNTPQRFTYEIEVTPGRYEVRVSRPTTKTISSRNGNTLQWQTLRAFLPSTKDFGNVSLVALKAKASNNLNDQAANRLNIIGTRELPIYDIETETWSAPTATRNPIWALCDAAKNSEYGGRLVDANLNLETLSALADDFATDGINFDFTFYQRVTLWEAFKAILRVGRAVPILNGSQISAVRDTVKTLPTAIFNSENIIANSFNLEVKLPGIDEFDGVEVEYIDPTTFLPETIQCLIGDDAGDNPEQVKLPGCTSRQIAYQEGLYLRRQRLLNRTAVSFATGLEGHIPSYGDLIGIAHDLPRWGRSMGVVIAVSTDRLTLTLSEPVTFTDDEDHVVFLRTRNGEVGGPYNVTAGEDEYEIVLESALPDVFNFDDQAEKPIFNFGIEEEWGQLCVVTNLEPQDDDQVRVRCVTYDPDLFLGDSETAPALPSATTPAAPPALPEVTGLEVSPVPNTPLLALISWKAALGARSYVVQTSTNGEDFETVATPTTPFLTIDVRPGDLWVRVAGVNVGAGPWAEWDGTVTPETLYPTDGGTSISELDGYTPP